MRQALNNSPSQQIFNKGSMNRPGWGSFCGCPRPRGGSVASPLPLLERRKTVLQPPSAWHHLWNQTRSCNPGTCMGAHKKRT